MKFLPFLLTFAFIVSGCSSETSQATPPVPTQTPFETGITTSQPVASATAAEVPDNPYSLPTSSFIMPTMDLSSPSGDQEPAMRNNNPIQPLIDAAVQKGESIVNIPYGIYRLDSGLYFSNIKNLTIEGNGSQFIFTLAKDSNAPYSYAFVIKDCDRFTLKNITVDYDPLPFTQGTVVGLDPDGTWYDVQIHAGYRSDAEFLQFDVDRHELSFKNFDPHTRLLKVGSSFLFPNKVTEIEPGLLRFWFEENPDKINHHHIQLGDYIATSAWRAVPLQITDSAYTKLDGVNIWAAGGGAISENGGEGGTDLRINIEPGPTPLGASIPRLWSASRDGYHVANLRHGPNIHDSRFDSLGDDMINVMTSFNVISGLDASTKRIKITDYGGGSPQHFRPGDILVAYDPVTFVEKARTKIVSVSAIYSELESVDGFSNGDVVVSPQISSAGTIVRNCNFRNGASEAIWVKAPDAVIENNTMEHLGQDGIGLRIELGYYKEGVFVQNTIIRGNTIRDTGFSALVLENSDGVGKGAINIGFTVSDDSPLNLYNNREFKNILIENNIIDSSTNWGLHIENASGVTVRNNTISNALVLPSGFTYAAWEIKPDSAIYVAYADHITFINNIVSELGPNGSQSIMLDPSADAATIDLHGVTLIP